MGLLELKTMKTFKQYLFSLPKYPSQTPPNLQGDPTKEVEDNEGEVSGGWRTGDPPRPIEVDVIGPNNIKSALKKATVKIKADRAK